MKRADPRQVTKLIYDKYSNAQYGERKKDCPMCKNGPDIRSHLFRCQHQSAIAISASVVQSMEQEPIPEQLYQNSILSHRQLLNIK
jgi:hypothetical protein